MKENKARNNKIEKKIKYVFFRENNNNNNKKKRKIYFIIIICLNQFY